MLYWKIISGKPDASSTYNLTLFNREKTNPYLFPKVKLIYINRDASDYATQDWASPKFGMSEERKLALLEYLS